MADRDARVGTGGMWLIGADGKPVDGLGGGGGGGGTPLPEELVQGLQDALQGYQDALESRQPHSANLDEFATIDPSDLAKQFIVATTKAAMLGILGAQPAASAISYRIGQLEDFPNNSLPTKADGWLPADGVTVYNIADDPRYAAFAAATGSGANYFGADLVFKDGVNYTSPGKQAPLVYHAGKWIYYAPQGGSAAYARSSPDLNVWTNTNTTNLYTQLGSNGWPALGVSFNGKVYLFGGGGSTTGFISSADGLTNWSAFTNLSTLFNIGGAGGTAAAIYLISARVIDNKLWIVGSSSSTSNTSPSFAAYMDAAGNWTRVATAPYSRPLLDIARKPAGTIVCPSYNGELLCSDDEGATWQQYATGVTDTLQAVAWDAAHGTFLIGGLGGRLVRTSTGKNNFVKGVISSAITNVNDIIVVGGLAVAACTGSGLDGRGRIHFTRDGADWDYKLINTSEVTTSAVRVVYNGGVFAFLTNSVAGYTWGVVANSVPSFDPGTQFFVSKATPRAGGYSVFARLGQ